MTKILFIPVSILGGLIAGMLGQKLFDRLWTLIDGSEDAPDPKDRETSWAKLLIGLALEGAIFAPCAALSITRHVQASRGRPGLGQARSRPRRAEAPSTEPEIGSQQQRTAAAAHMGREGLAS